MREMTKIVKEQPQHNETNNDALDTFGKFVATELRGIHVASNDFVVRQAKRKIQQVLMATWDTIDQPTIAPSPASSHDSWRPQPQEPLDNFSPPYHYSNGQIDVSDSNNLIDNALRMANVTGTDFLN